MYRGPRLEGLNVSKKWGLAVHMLYWTNCITSTQRWTQAQGSKVPWCPIPPRSHWKLVDSLSPFPLPQIPSFKPSSPPLPQTARANGFAGAAEELGRG